MSDGHDRQYEAGVDREVSLKGIVYTGVVLALIVVVFGVLMWWLSLGLRAGMVAGDPPPPVLPEARVQELPPEPRLQTDPTDDLRILRAEEDEFLTGYNWIDEGGGIARVPIERAMELMAAGALETGSKEQAEGGVTGEEMTTAAGEDGS